MRYLFFLVLLIGCKNTSNEASSVKLDSLAKENEKLKNELNEVKPDKVVNNDETTASETSRYCYVLITYIKREMGDGLRGLEDVKYLTWSDITEVSKFDEETKYKLMDEFEKGFLAHTPAYFKTIAKRECYVFDSYVEASKHLAKMKSL